MAEHYSFFNSVNGDRKYKAEDWAEYFNFFLTNGVHPNPATNLQVTATNSDMRIIVKAGKAWINGHMYFNDSDLYLTLDNADGSTNRIDRIVVCLDTANRIISARVKHGDYATSPVAKDLQRDADYWELALADVAVNAGATSITQANITDQRLNTALCGIVDSLIQADTTAIFNQFEKWFDNTRALLDGDAEGKILNAIAAVREANYLPNPATSTDGNAYTCTSGQSYATLPDRIGITLVATVNSTGTVTINVDGLGAKPTKRANGLNVVLYAGGEYQFRWNAATGNFISLGDGGWVTGDTVTDGTELTALHNAGDCVFSASIIGGTLLTIDDTAIYFAMNSSIYAYSISDGHLIWSASAGGHIITFDSAYFYSLFSGTLRKISRSDGTITNVTITITTANYEEFSNMTCMNDHLYLLKNCDTSSEYSIQYCMLYKISKAGTVSASCKLTATSGYLTNGLNVFTDGVSIYIDASKYDTDGTYKGHAFCKYGVDLAKVGIDSLYTDSYASIYEPVQEGDHFWSMIVSSMNSATLFSSFNYSLIGVDLSISASNTISRLNSTQPRIMFQHDSVVCSIENNCSINIFSKNTPHSLLSQIPLPGSTYSPAFSNSTYYEQVNVGQMLYWKGFYYTIAPGSSLLKIYGTSSYTIN